MFFVEAICDTCGAHIRLEVESEVGPLSVGKARAEAAPGTAVLDRSALNEHVCELPSEDVQVSAGDQGAGTE